MSQNSLAAAALILSSLASGAKAQYPQTYYVPGYTYTYAYPARPVYAPTYRPVVPQYQYQQQSIRPANPTGYRNRPYYGAYGYGINSNGSTDGFPPFRGRAWR